MKKLFGTDGVRGIYGTELTEKLAYQLGRYGAYVLTGKNPNPKIIIGRDTRESGKALQKALSEGVVSVGGDVLLAEVVPTPAVAILTRSLNADAGIVISASHNPYRYNGIKFFDSKGYKLPDEVEHQIENLIFEGRQVDSNTKGNISTIENPESIYINELLKYVKPDLKNIKIVMDCANGSNYTIAPKIYKNLGAELILIGTNPNGKNINDKCGSTHLEKLVEGVLKEKADVGIAFDGDADRCLVVDNKGDTVDGDKILNIFAAKMLEEKTLNKNTVVVTVMSNIGLDIALRENCIQSIKTDVGDRYVLEEMIKGGYNLGGEQSGHIILLDCNTTGDGLLTSLMLTKILKESNTTLAELGNKMTSYPQVLINARVENHKKNQYISDELIANEIEKINKHFEGKGRVLIRPSGTEPLVRVMIEGEDLKEINEIAVNMANLIEMQLN